MAFTLHQLLAESAQREPDREAVRCLGRSLSYGQLESAANGLARTLIDSGVGRGDRVAIHLPKSVEMVAAVYGVLKAGAAYVPLDLKAPVSRLSVVAADCTISGLITTPARAQSLLGALDGNRPGAVILVDDGSAPGELAVPGVTYAEATRDREAPDPSVPAIDTDLAYILYTSGSTGVPKGVMLTHRNALTFVEWCAASIGVRPDDVLSNHAPLNFDLSVLDLFLAAFGGATVVPVPERAAYFGDSLARLIGDEGITMWYSVPSALMILMRFLKEPDPFPRLRTVVFAGEVFPTKQLRALRRALPRAELWNLYGPTETNVCTYYRVRELPEDDRTIPIGRACENTEVFALKDDGTRAGIGEEGELYVRGSTVMRGYWGRPEKTREVLVPNPLAPREGEPAYRTGDLVRLREDGDLDFLGRRDHQVKSRGYRIELGEIEAALNAHPDLVEAVAVAVPHAEWGTAIVARVVPKEGLRPAVTEMKRFVAGRLPQYMVPASIELVEGLPRTSTGKVDRRRILDEAGAEEIVPARR